VQNTSVIELRQRLQKFNETWDIFNGIQSAIEEIETGTEDESRHDEERQQPFFKERYFATMSAFESIIEGKLSTITNVNLNQTSRHLRETIPATYGSGSNDHVKLPRVNLPTFAGSFEEWIQFRNMFQSVIDEHNAT